MKFEMRGPCAHCPFRYDVPGFLKAARAEEIAESLVDCQETFPCHNTVDHDGGDYDEGGGVVTADSQHCAGAAIMLEHMERPNQLMRIAERFGMYDRTKLRMDAPVFTSDEEFMAHHNA